MNWGSLDQFLAMGGYGLYVWGAYGVVLAAMAMEIGLAVLRRRQIQAHLGHLLRLGGHRDTTPSHSPAPGEPDA